MARVSHQSQVLDWLAAALADADTSDARQVEAVLAGFYARLDLFRRELGGLTEPRFQALVPLSRETPTHYKWHLFASDDAGVRVWLHEYKRKAVRSGGYAQSIHNHRYSMSALLLAGGYCYSGYEVSCGADDLEADVRLIRIERIGEGRAYSMRPDEYHSVTEIQDGTVSLVIQGRPVRNYSTSVDTASRRLVRHTPIELRLGELRSVLRVSDAWRTVMEASADGESG